MYAMKENGAKVQVMRFDCLKAKDGTCYIVDKVLEDKATTFLLIPKGNHTWDCGKEVALTEAEVNQCILF